MSVMVVQNKRKNNANTKTAGDVSVKLIAYTCVHYHFIKLM